MFQRIRKWSGVVGGRGLVSVGLSLAVVASPDILFRHVAHGDAARSRDIAATMDSVLSLSRLLATPLVAMCIDSQVVGRRGTLSIACLVQAVGRAVVAQNPESLPRYCCYRILNLLGVHAMMLASSALIVDLSGGRNSYYTTAMRRLLMFLAILRACSSHLAGTGFAPAALMRMSAYSAALAAVVFFFLTREPRRTAREAPAKEASEVGPPERAAEAVGGRLSEIFKAWTAAATFFFRTPLRRTVALLILIRALNPMLMASQLQEHWRERFHWEAPDRARLNAFSDLAQCFVPFLLIEILGYHPRAENGTRSAMRLLAASFFNTAFTPYPQTVFLNPVLEHAVSGQGFIDQLVHRVSSGEGQGRVEAALSLIEFPLSFFLPQIFAQTSKGNTRIPLVIIALLLLLGSELVLPWVATKSKQA